MKKHIFVWVLLLSTITSLAQIHISVDDPATWTTQALVPYIGQTVVFDAPIVVCSNARSELTVSPRRMFTPSNQAYPLTSSYKSVVTLNSSGAMNLSGDRKSVV